MEYLTIEDGPMMEIIRDGDSMLDQWMREDVCAQIVEDIQAKFNSGPPGRYYKSRGYYASRPGYPPNDYTGELKESYHYFRGGDGSYYIADGVPYGLYLEYGTQHPVPHAPRPHVTPTIEEWRRGRLEREFFSRFSGPGGRFTSISARYASRMRGR